MSNHGYPPGDHSTKDGKQDSSKASQGQTVPFVKKHPQVTAAGDIHKTGYLAQIKHSVPSRPIAPAPTTSHLPQSKPVNHLLLTGAAQKAASLNLVRGPSTMGNQEGKPIGTGNANFGNTRTPIQLQNLRNVTPGASPAQTAQLPPSQVAQLSQLSQQTQQTQGGRLSQAIANQNTASPTVAVTASGSLNPVAAQITQNPQIQMASIIRSSVTNAQAVPGQQSQIQVKTGKPVAPSAGFGSHVPRGTAAASALSAPTKTGAVATPILRPNPPPGILGQNQLLAARMNAPLVTPVRPGTPPTTTTRAASPVVSSGDTGSRPAHFTPHSTTSTTTTTVQITIQQPNARLQAVDMSAAAAAAAHPTKHNKPVHLSQAMVHPHTTHKVVLSQATVAPMMQPSSMVTTVTKSAPLQVSIHSHTSSLAATTTTSTTSASTIPIARVNPQRQAVPPTLGHQTEVRSDNTAQLSGGSLFIPHAHRGSPNTVSTGISLQNSVSLTDSRQQDSSRNQLPHVAPPGPYDLYSPLQLGYHPPQFMYYPSPTQGFTPISTGPSLRPSIYPSQTPNLAATLQGAAAAAAHGVSVTGTQGLRGAPTGMVVTVDPSRHPPSVHTQQYTAIPSEVSTNTSDAPPATSGVQSLQRNSTTPQPSPGGSNNPNNPSASPRPSILRKRTNDGTILVRKNLTGPLEASAGSPQSASLPRSATSSPCKAQNDTASQSSTDTAPSTENNSPAQSTEMKIKTEPLEGAPIENGLLSVPHTVASVLQNNMEASPRKKPRKQLLNINEELKDSSTEDETETKLPVKEERETEIKPPMPKEYTDEEGVRWVAMRKRNTVTLMNSYHCTWKARNNHFLRASDVKPKDERRPTVNELSNQKSVIQKANGWKLYHLAAQLEEMMDLEKVVHSRIARLQKTAAAKPDIPFTEEEVHKIKEQSQANKQRSQLFMDQLEEAKSSMLRILDHKPRIMEIINKHHSKRPVKKKERT